MKKLSNKFLVFMMAFALICSMSMSSMAVYAAEPEVIAEASAPAEMTLAIEAAEEEAAAAMTIQPRASYYPVSGASSGVFYGMTSNAAIYNYLPAGTVKISYSIEGAGNCYLRFYPGTVASGSYYQSNVMSGNSTGTTQVVLGMSSTYTVVLFYGNGNASTEVIYAFNLYT